jgi:hypothetical protein
MRPKTASVIAQMTRVGSVAVTTLKHPKDRLSDYGTQFMKHLLGLLVLVVMAGCASTVSGSRGKDAGPRRSLDCAGKLMMLRGQWTACTPEESVDTILQTHRSIIVRFREDPAHEAAPRLQLIDLAPGELCSGRLPARMQGAEVMKCLVYGPKEILEPQS